LFQLDPDSRAELDELDDEALATIVERVLADPSGRREPQHNYTRRFQNAKRYVKGLAKDEKVWELKPNHWRALFVTLETDDGRKGLFFLPVKGTRFWTMSDCPWH
jgi:hypothetical protein